MARSKLEPIPPEKVQFNGEAELYNEKGRNITAKWKIISGVYQLNDDRYRITVYQAPVIVNDHQISQGHIRTAIWDDKNGRWELETFK